MTPFQTLPELASKLALLLQDSKATYCLIGGLAVVLHGYVRATKDVDFFVEHMPDWEPILAHCASLGLTLHEQDRELAEEGLLFLRADTTAAFGADLLRVESKFERGLLQRAEEHDIGGTKVRVIKLEDLIALKLYVGRTQDDADAEALLDLRQQDLDYDALQASAAELGIQAKLTAFLQAPHKD